MDLMKMVYVIIGITISVIIAAKAHVMEAHTSIVIDSFMQGGKCAAAGDLGSDERFYRSSQGRSDVVYTDHPLWNTHHYRNSDDGCSCNGQERRVICC